MNGKRFMIKRLVIKRLVSKRLVIKRLVIKRLGIKRLVKEDDIDEKREQADVSSLHREAVISVIIIARWHLHVQVFTFGESTGDESTLYRNPRNAN